MKSDWCSEHAPWDIVAQSIRNGELGAVAAINIQQSIDSVAGEIDIQAWSAQWSEKFNTWFGNPIVETAITTPHSRSVLLSYSNGPIVRLFGDTRTNRGPTSLNFEVIGDRQSMIYRPQGGLLGAIHCNNGKGWIVLDSPVVSSLTNCCSDMPPVRLGVISLEHPHAIGNHFPALEAVPQAVQVVAIADTDAVRAQAWAQRFSAQHIDTRDQMLAAMSMDAVLVTSRNCDHATDAITVMEQDRDVFCDKPIATNQRDGQTLIDTVERTGRRFVTTYPCRHHPAVLKLRALINRGELGRIEAIAATNHGCMYAPDTPPWVIDPYANGGGCIIDHTVHVADLIRWLTDSEFAEVHALAATRLHDIPAEDIAVMHGQMTDGTMYQIDASWSRKATDPNWGDVTLRVIGDHGSATLDLYNNQTIQVYTENGVEFRYPNLLTHQHAMIFLDYQREKATGFTGINANHWDGLRTLELALAAYDSVRVGGSVKVARYQSLGSCHA